MCLKNKTQKIIKYFIFVLFVQFFIFVKTNINFANSLDNIAIDVIVNDNGSATIIQEWTGTFEDGTEVFLPIEDTSLIIKDFQVSLDGTLFNYVDQWNVDGSFSEKAWRCGINKTSKGVELCFGISKQGTNTYRFSYTVDPLFKSYIDKDGFNFQFINEDMNLKPKNFSFILSLANKFELSQENANIWAFGFNGNISFNNGYIYAFSNSSPNYANIMVSIKKGIISPNIEVNDYFDTVKNTAFKKSDYNNFKESVFKIILFLCLLLIIGIVLSFIFSKIKRYIDLKKLYKSVNYFRDIPNEKNLFVTYVLYKDFDIWHNNQSNIIVAMLMQMVHDKYLTPLEEKKSGFFGNIKTATSLQIGLEPQNGKYKEFYNMLSLAAGDNKILEKNELKKYMQKNVNHFNNFVDSLESEGHSALNKLNAYKKLLGKNLNSLTEKGKKELSEVYGLRKYIDEFTLIEEKSVKEVDIWEYLLIYATLFGLSKKVFKELKKIYPEQIAKIEQMETTYVYCNTFYMSSMVSNIPNIKIDNNAISGFGGATSIGGGGGFSGGGHGGGTR